MNIKKSYNKYVFLSYGIGGVGGGQNYLKNRCELYKEQGLKVYLAYTLYDSKCSKHLFDAVMRIQAIGQPISLFCEWYIRVIIDKIQDLIEFKKGDNVIIESNNQCMAFWGEMLAKSCNGKHFYYILGENDLINNKFDDAFFKFKLDRKEIAGIHQDSVKRLFQSFRVIENSELYLVKAAAQSCIEDYRIPVLENLPSCDYTIGLLSRLDKPYVMPTLKNLKEFFDAHKDKIHNLIIVGDGSKNIIQNIKQLYHCVNNVNLIFTGALDPIPAQYPKLCNVCIGTAGCALKTHIYGRITITIDGEDFMPIGILGHTTENRLFRSNEPIVSIKILLEQILIEKKYPIWHGVIPIKSDREEYHKIHHNYILNSSSKREYYDILINMNIKCKFKGFIFIVKRVFESIIGTRFYYKIAGDL